jgi:hypothetical protein
MYEPNILSNALHFKYIVILSKKSHAFAGENIVNCSSASTQLINDVDVYLKGKKITNANVRQMFYSFNFLFVI